jgi:predicted metal-binding membrane protein
MSSAPAQQLRQLVRVRLIRRPESWLYVVALLGGVGVVVPHVAGSSPVSQSRDEGHHHAPAPDIGGWLGEWRHWSLMVVAMMIPVAAPYARRVALGSLWSCRQRATAWFVVGYLSVWLAVGAVLAAVLARFDRASAWPVTAIALLGAAAWQVCPPRRRVLRRCRSLAMGAVKGWRADRDCASLGLRVGLRCAFVCGPVMLAMAVGQSVILMGGIFALLLTERARGPNPHRRAGRPLEAWCLVTLAAVVAAVALVSR